MFKPSFESRFLELNVAVRKSESLSGAWRHLVILNGANLLVRRVRLFLTLTSAVCLYCWREETRRGEGERAGTCQQKWKSLVRNPAFIIYHFCWICRSHYSAHISHWGEMCFLLRLETRPHRIDFIWTLNFCRTSQFILRSLNYCPCFTSKCPAGLTYCSNLATLPKHPMEVKHTSTMH